MFWILQVLVKDWPGSIPLSSGMVTSIGLPAIARSQTGVAEGEGVGGGIVAVGVGPRGVGVRPGTSVSKLVCVGLVSRLAGMAATVKVTSASTVSWICCDDGVGVPV